MLHENYKFCEKDCFRKTVDSQCSETKKATPSIVVLKVA